MASINGFIHKALNLWHAHHQCFTWPTIQLPFQFKQQKTGSNCRNYNCNERKYSLWCCPIIGHLNFIQQQLHTLWCVTIGSIVHPSLNSHPFSDYFKSFYFWWNTHFSILNRFILNEEKKKKKTKKIVCTHLCILDDWETTFYYKQHIRFLHFLQFKMVWQ